MPVSSFWANYVTPGAQNDVAMSGDLEEDVEKRLKRKVVQYINENNVPDLTDDDIVWFGIRDWGREPHGGTNHAWRPERRKTGLRRRRFRIAKTFSRGGTSWR
jgi:hypothetical protein